MKRFLVPLLEYGSLVLALALLALLLGPPQGRRKDVRGMEGPAPASLSSSVEKWEQELVLPRRSDRIANYTMGVRLNTATNIIKGWEILEWKNTTGRPQSDFPFHLYHNAWKNNRSTFARENDFTLRGRFLQEREYGYTNVRKIILLDGREEIDLMPTFRYIQPDDGNPDDQTVFQISIPRPLRPGATMRLMIEFETKQPAPIARTGVIRNYHFVGQWFPKIGVWWNGAWNCHQFHATSEFFADFGVYDVDITVPAGYVVGATGGIPRSVTEHGDSTVTYNFYQEDVIDFAWVTSPDLVRTVRTFVHDAMDEHCSASRHHDLRPVDVIVLTQPHHGNLIDRYFDATFKALRFYGEWYGEYPYPTVTVVDPANGSRSGGMEYPTLFTGGGNMFVPREQASPEGVTVHEFGHQFWYALVATNEFDEAWMDEGFNTYSTARVITAGWPPFSEVRYFFGGPGAGSFVGIPYVLRDAPSERFATGNLEIRRLGKNDVMAKKAWEYGDFESYRLNAYTKPAMSLVMLERYLGEPMMYRVMRTYHHRYRFRHPTARDFINLVNEVTGTDMRWFFDNTWYSSNLFNYAVDGIANIRVPPPQGRFDINGNPLEPSLAEHAYLCEVVVKREGEAIAPVDVLVEFDDGRQILEAWDGKDRWRKFAYHTDVPVRFAVVDPEQKLVLDINYHNNSKVVREEGFRSLAARKLASKWMFWFQVQLESAAFWQ